MVIFTGGKSVAINSPRHLTLRHARNAVQSTKGSEALEPEVLEIDSLETSADEPIEDPTPPLEAGQAQLHSYWAPGLEAGKKHEISVIQDIKAPTDERTLRLTAKQNFYVDAPQFVLPEGSVYSFYPPQGYADDRRILPHIVLSDPHLPWERIGSPSAEHNDDTRNKVPWLALFTFSHDELLLQPGGLGEKETKQSQAGAVKMTVGDFLKLDNIATPIVADPSKDVKDLGAEFIFVKADLFTSLFSTFDDKNNRQVGKHPNTDQYKYLSHVRKINTKGMAIAGVEDFGIFSCVIGNRCGPLNNPTAANISVHLVSIEGVEEMEWPKSGQSRVGLCSLHNWTYTVLPPGQFNVRDAFEHLGRELNVLRPAETVFKPLQTSGSKVSVRLGDRVKDGYSLVQYRVQTGEKTVALYRGPFTPVRVDLNEQLNKCSNSGQDFQILDKKVGLMDISYSIAWQIGRTLALGDKAYVAALSRLRSILRTKTMKACKIDAVTDAGTDQSYRSRDDLLKDLPKTIERLHQIQLAVPPTSVGDGPHYFAPGGAKKRWYRPELSKRQYPKLGFSAKPIQEKYLEAAVEIVLKELSMGKDGRVYDETNDPVSTDWMVVLAWILDRMFLDRIPAHYLISDPSHLPPESLRFFHIDPNWVDAMIDGALSLANHMGQDLDRVAIKHGINRYLEYQSPKLTHRPQVPTYGFYLRSDLVTLYPDLRVNTTGADTGRAPLLRHEIIADGVMLGLFDCIPGQDFKTLNFTQPPHQQRFSAGWYLEADKLQISIGREFTVDAKHQDYSKPEEPWQRVTMLPSSEDNWFTWSTIPKPLVGGKDEGDPDADLRILRLPSFVQKQMDLLNANMGSFDDGGNKQDYFHDTVPNSALLAMQLNDPYYQLIISLDKEEASGQATSSPLSGLRTAATGPVQELRSLRFITPTTVPRVPQPDDVDLDPLESDTIVSLQASSLDTVAETWERDESFVVRSRTLGHHLPPHHRAPITEHLHVAMTSQIPHGVPVQRLASTRRLVAPQVGMLTRTTSTSSQSSNLAGPPVYTCNAYSLQQDVIIQDKDYLPQDIVFSVLVSRNKYSSYQLTEFDIAIELGTSADNNCIMETYAGPGARMLSNLRFNVLMSFTTMPVTERKCLLLRLIPRSHKRWIRMQDVHEMSFMLTLAQLNSFAGDERFSFYTSAYYKFDHEHDPITDYFEVTLKKHH
ncbi:uncharacterized protein FSUBG_7382 [Fusarium subglutinans]|uniref:Uncharacterized protein n=1 Tax=Gibberella subglutinans TaxID=42677 RepID=A0A8H5PUM4_GIBSU|nr:uncharacterized protein FSUBG_7382 [Fusarium subglutinans]KAF5603159.1 hypothetical protein FSUBG_7382 [Fusarium subglutinans]